MVGSGGVKGIYFPVAERLCYLINQRIRIHGIRCGIATSAGSAENIKGVADGRFQFGIVQSNSLLAYVPPSKEVAIQTIATLHPEPIHIAVRKESSFQKIGDLSHAIVNVGDDESGTRTVAIALLAAANVTLPEELQRQFGPSNQARELCRKNVDAIIFVSGIRNSSMTEAHRRCEVRLLPIEPAIASILLKSLPGLEPMTIPPNTYPGQDAAVESLGPVARIVARADALDGLVKLMDDAITGELGPVYDVHPALGNIDAISLSQIFEGESLHSALAVRPVARP